MKSQSEKLQEYQRAIQEGFSLLEKEKAYQQVQVLRKMKTLKLGVAPASLSNILKDKKMGAKVLQRTQEGICKIIEAELGLVFDAGKRTFIADPSFRRLEVIKEYDDRKVGPEKQVLLRTDGRLSIEEKVEFWQSAKEEIIELGVRLSTFSSYLHSRKKKDFVNPLKEILERGVHVKLYLLDPDANGTGIYFNDRAVVQKEEAQSVARIQNVIQEFKNAYQKYKLGEHQGNFEVYMYRHLPYGHFLIVDSASWNGKMIVSQYLYGISRAHCPSIEISRYGDSDLYEKYLNSFEYLTATAKQIEFEK